MNALVSLAEAFEDVLTVARTARAPTAAWRTLCIRQRRRLGTKVGDALGTIELDDDVARVRAIARELSGELDTLVFSLFDAIDDGTAAAGFSVARVTSGGRAASDFMHDPWAREHTYLRCRALDAVTAIARQADLRTRPLVESVMAFAAVALVARFATSDLSRRIVVAFDDERARPLPGGVPAFAEITAEKKKAPAPERRSLPAQP